MCITRFSSFFFFMTTNVLDQIEALLDKDDVPERTVGAMVISLEYGDLQRESFVTVAERTKSDRVKRNVQIILDRFEPIDINRRYIRETVAAIEEKRPFDPSVRIPEDSWALSGAVTLALEVNALCRSRIEFEKNCLKQRQEKEAERK